MIPVKKKRCPQFQEDSHRRRIKLPECIFKIFSVVDKFIPQKEMDTALRSKAILAPVNKLNISANN